MPTHPIKIKLNKQVTTTILAKLPINSQLRHTKPLAIIANQVVASLGAQDTAVSRIMAGVTQTITRRLFRENAHSSLAIAERALAALLQVPKFISQRINIKMEVMDTMETLVITIIWETELASKITIKTITLSMAKVPRPLPRTQVMATPQDIEKSFL